jgi:hypothetical protein
MSVSQRPYPKIGYKQIEVAGYEVNVCHYVADGAVIECAVLLGPPNRAGIRLKDSDVAKHERRRVRELVANELGLPLGRVSASTRYNGGADKTGPVKDIQKFGLRRDKMKGVKSAPTAPTYPIPEKTPTPDQPKKRSIISAILASGALLAGMAGLPVSGPFSGDMMDTDPEGGNDA